MRILLRCGAPAALAALVLLSSASPATAAEPAGGGWLRPVPGALVHPFEEPSSVYGPGHRGADLAAPPGPPVLAANDGEVTFAGPVAGTQHVTVQHTGGLRITYSFLQSVAVRRGQTVARGDVVGASGGTNDDHDGTVLHLGLRLGERYLDPMQLFGPVDLTEVVRLAPADAPVESSWTVADERRELTVSLRLPVPGLGARARATTDGCGDGIPLVGAIVSGACDAATWLGDRAGDALDAGLDTVGALTGIAPDVLGGLRASLAATLDGLRALHGEAAAVLARTPPAKLALDLVAVGRRFVDTITAECSTDAPAADGTGGSHHRVMVVAGINSSGLAGEQGPTVDFDVEALGYRPDEDEVRWYSYAADGGAYEARDTHGPLDRAAGRLGDQLRAMQREQPGREVDLIAHSQGGIVVDVFLARHYEASDPTLPPLGNVVTLSSPHEGAPLATAGDTIRSAPLGEPLLDGIGSIASSIPPPNGVSVREMSEHSELMREVRRRGVPEHFDVTSIGAAEDVVVPASHISLEGAQETVVAVNAASQHSAVLGDPDALRAVRAALEGRAPPCVGLDTALRSAVAPVVISRVTHEVGGLASTVLGGR